MRKRQGDGQTIGQVGGEPERQGDKWTIAQRDKLSHCAIVSRPSLLSLFLFFTLFIFIPLTSQAQTGEITGRVVTEDGAGARYVTVYLNAVAADRRPTSTFSQNRTTTDEDGNFKFTELAPRVYSVGASPAKGYVQRPVPLAERQDGGFHRVGANVTITMIKGGVITGRVTNATGEPLIGVQINAAMVRDTEGNTVRGGGGRSRLTDDRGVYRLYGLPPGTYVVYTRSSFSGPSPYDLDAPTYHPSSTRETATEVTVSSGAEVSGVDIRYRGDQGNVVSGVVTGGPESSLPYSGISVSLTSVAASAYLGVSNVVRRDDGTSGFSIHGVTDGEYEIIARRSISNEEFLVSTPRRIVIKGADVGGIELKLLPLGSITGKFAVESAPNACESKRKWLLEETLLALRSEAKPAGSISPPKPSVVNGLNDKGEFTVYNLEANRYFLEPRLPNENWYVKSITASVSPPANARDSAARNSTPADVARSGVALKAGEKISGVTVTIADGAASVSGKVSPAKEGSRLPARLRVHLVPAEAAATNDVLRYAEALARSDGSFSLRNISPGKYWLVARAASDDEPSDGTPQPVAWDSIERAKLRKEAEAMKVEIVLKPCQRVTDQIVKQY
jgi:hypothetical protein